MDKILVALLVAFSCVTASTIEKRAPCTRYTIIDSRGTFEPYGQTSSGFKDVNDGVYAQVPGGNPHNTDYPAAADQNSESGTVDIVNTITNTLAADPAHCFILEGYSQGAAATVNAMPRLTGAAFNAVVGVLLIGNPLHKPGLACNVDQFGGDSTKYGVGFTESKGSIPDNWVSKTLDVCVLFDGVCDFPLCPFGPLCLPHAQYPFDPFYKNLGTNYVVGRLRGNGPGKVKAKAKARDTPSIDWDAFARSAPLISRDELARNLPSIPPSREALLAAFKGVPV